MKYGRKYTEVRTEVHKKYGRKYTNKTRQLLCLVFIYKLCYTLIEEVEET